MWMRQLGEGSVESGALLEDSECWSTVADDTVHTNSMESVIVGSESVEAATFGNCSVDRDTE